MPIKYDLPRIITNDSLIPIVAFRSVLVPNVCDNKEK